LGQQLTPSKAPNPTEYVSCVDCGNEFARPKGTVRLLCKTCRQQRARQHRTRTGQQAPKHHDGWSTVDAAWDAIQRGDLAKARAQCRKIIAGLAPRIKAMIDQTLLVEIDELAQLRERQRHTVEPRWTGTSVDDAAKLEEARRRRARTAAKRLRARVGPTFAVSTGRTAKCERCLQPVPWPDGKRRPRFCSECTPSGWDRSNSVRTVSGGLPSLGRRR